MRGGLSARKLTGNPSVRSLSRQNLNQLENSSIEKASKGGYVLRDVANADVTLVGTGSEVAIAVEAAELLEKSGVKARVASLPCWEVFRQQSSDYKLSVLPDGAPIVSVEAYTVRLPHESARSVPLIFPLTFPPLLVDYGLGRVLARSHRD